MNHKNTEGEIRSALHRKKFRRHHICNETLVIDELGLAHAKARIDIAVINGCVHGYEIKSAVDTLYRLPGQISLYQDCLEKLTIVCAENHLDGVRKLAPYWCGIILANKGPRGAIHFDIVQNSRRNPQVQTASLAQLLWRDEARQILSRFDIEPSILRKPRKTLYQELASRMTEREITKYIKSFMCSRQRWRDHLTPA